jgi:hypothetical protein
VPAAVEFTAATAGRTVTFSALTVAAALCGLLAFGDPTFTSVAVGGISTVLVALAAAVTLLPALLASWGPKLKMAHRQEAEDGFFGRLTRRVQRRPILLRDRLGRLRAVPDGRQRADSNNRQQESPSFALPGPVSQVRANETAWPPSDRPASGPGHGGRTPARDPPGTAPPRTGRTPPPHHPSGTQPAWTAR